MESQLKQAKERMEAGGHTAVACREGVFYTADERGVRPLLAWLDGGVDLSGGVAADRVVGRAAALLYVLLGVRAVWAGILSRPAQEVFEQNGIEADCGVLVDAIRDRAGTGFCRSIRPLLRLYASTCCEHTEEYQLFLVHYSWGV